MAKEELFHATISQEPSTGAIRGKLPGRMVAAMNADPGDVIEFAVVKGKIVSGRVLSSREARDYKGDSGRSAPAKAKKSTGKAKPSKKAAKSTGSKKASKSAKSSKRKTKVEYDEPRSKKGKKKLKLTKKGRK